MILTLTLALAPVGPATPVCGICQAAPVQQEAA